MAGHRLFQLFLGSAKTPAKTGSCLIPTHYLISLRSWVKDMLEWIQVSPPRAKGPQGLLRKGTGRGESVPGDQQHLCLASRASQGHMWTSLPRRWPTSPPHSRTAQPALLYGADILKPFSSFQMCQKADTCSLVFTLCFTFVSAFQ